MLNAAQLTECNSAVAAPAITEQLDPNIARQGQRPPPPPRVPLTPQVSATPIHYSANLSRSVGGRALNVSAAGVTWYCNQFYCTADSNLIIDPVSACSALREAVAPLTSGPASVLSFTFLTEAQLSACNAVVSPATPATPTQVAIELYSRPGEITAHVLIPSGLRFHGVTPALPAPALPAPHRIVGGRLDTEGVSLRASSPGATATPRSDSASTTPRYSTGMEPAAIGTPPVLTLRVPVQLDDMPGATAGIELDCALFYTRFVPFIGANPDPAYEALATLEGAYGAQRVVATGVGRAFIRAVAHYDGVFDIPMRLRPFYRLQDARSYSCTVLLETARPGPHGIVIDRTVLSKLAGPGSTIPEFWPAAGSTPRLTVEGNIQ